MAHTLVMPRQGNTVESCIILKWLKKEGEAVTAAEPVCEVETDKAAFEVPAGADGILLKILRPAGDDVPVLEPIAVVGAVGEKVEAAPAASAVSPSAPQEAAARAPAPDVPSASAAGAPARPAAGQESGAVRGVSPRARNLASEKAIDPSVIPGTGPGGRVIERDVRAVAESMPGLTAAASEALRAGGYTVPSEGTGVGGRVRAGDLAARGTVPEAGRPAAASAAAGTVTETPIRGIRKIIADRMHESLASTAQFTLTMSAPADRLFNLRSRFKESSEALGFRNITINDLVLYAALRTLEEFPFMNAHKTGDTIRTFSDIHLGLAVDTPRGLMVPVIRNAHSLSLRQLAAEAKRLGEACRDGKAQPDELSGSTFTVTNLGGTGVESFTPVINPPEVAILGVCALRNEAVPDEKLGFRFERKLGLSLTIDHQAVDGAPAARFLKALCAAIADIDLALAR